MATAKLQIDLTDADMIDNDVSAKAEDDEDIDFEDITKLVTMRREQSVCIFF